MGGSNDDDVDRAAKSQSISNPERPRVLLDVDGVLADFIGSYLDIVEDVTGRRYQREEVVEFDIGRSLRLSPEESAACKRALGDYRGFCSALRVYDGAQNGVAALEAIADVFIVTSPWNSNETWTHEREAWLKRHFDIGHDRVIHTSAKHVCRGDFFVDDKVTACIKWQHEHPNALALVWDNPHNRRSSWGVRVCDWDALHRIVSGAVG